METDLLKHIPCSVDLLEYPNLSFLYCHLGILGSSYV